MTKADKVFLDKATKALHDAGMPEEKAREAAQALTVPSEVRKINRVRKLRLEIEALNRLYKK